MDCVFWEKLYKIAVSSQTIFSNCCDFMSWYCIWQKIY
jgi:hypothetical protein